MIINNIIYIVAIFILLEQVVFCWSLLEHLFFRKFVLLERWNSDQQQKNKEFQKLLLIINELINLVGTLERWSKKTQQNF